MGLQQHLDLELWCPLSGIFLEGERIPPHKMHLLQCCNGTLFARCSNHVARCFFSDWGTIKKIMNTAKVIRMTEPQQKKEKRNGKT